MNKQEIIIDYVFEHGTFPFADYLKNNKQSVLNTLKRKNQDIDITDIYNAIQKLKKINERKLDDEQVIQFKKEGRKTRQSKAIAEKDSYNQAYRIISAFKKCGDKERQKEVLIQVLAGLEYSHLLPYLYAPQNK